MPLVSLRHQCQQQAGNLFIADPVCESVIDGKVVEDRTEDKHYPDITSTGIDLKDDGELESITATYDVIEEDDIEDENTGEDRDDCSLTMDSFTQGHAPVKLEEKHPNACISKKSRISERRR